MKLYEDMHVLERKYWGNFFPNKKTGLNILECYGLEAVAKDFIHEYEESAFGEIARRNIGGFLRINREDGYVDIFDGVYDTYEFDGYLIDKFWTTYNGCLLLTAYKIPEDCEEWQDHDWLCEFEEVLIRLD